MSEILVRNVVEKEKGYLYYIDGEGNVCRAKQNQGRVKGQKNKRKYVTQEQKEKMEF